MINVWCILFFTFNLTQLLNRFYNTAPNNCNVIFIILASCKWSTSNFFGLPTSLDSSQTRRTIRKAIHTQKNHAQINWDGNLKPGIRHESDRIIGNPLNRVIIIMHMIYALSLLQSCEIYTLHVTRKMMHMSNSTREARLFSLPTNHLSTSWVCLVGWIGIWEPSHFGLGTPILSATQL